MLRRSGCRWWPSRRHCRLRLPLTCPLCCVHQAPPLTHSMRASPPQEPNAESRAAVQSGKPVTPAGLVVLDPEPDVREVLLLSEEMQLDEVLAVLCVQGALQEVGAGPRGGMQSSGCRHAYAALRTCEPSLLTALQPSLPQAERLPMYLSVTTPGRLARCRRQLGRASFSRSAAAC